MALDIKKRVWLGGLATCALLLPAIVWLIQPGGHTLSWVLTGVLVALGALLTFCYFQASWPIYTRTDIGDDPTYVQPDPDRVLARSKNLALSTTEAVRFTRMLVDPTATFQRISESVEPMTRSVGVTTTASLTVTGNPDETVVVPIVLQRRGVIEKLRFSDDEGRRLSSLSTSETAAYILVVIRLHLLACGLKYLSYYREKIERDVAKYLLNPKDNKASDLRGIQEKLYGFNIDPKNRAILDEVAKLLGSIMLHHPLCVPFPLNNARKLFSYEPRKLPSGTHDAGGNRDGSTAPQRFAYSIRLSAHVKTIVEFHHEKKRGLRHWIELIRGAFGILPTIITVPLENATRAQSYHLHVAGPDRTYLAWQSILSGEGKPLEKDGHVVAAVRRGQRHAHLYTRQGFSDPKAQYLAQFYERMPGSMAPAAMSAFSVAILVWLGLLASKQQILGDPILPSWEYAALVLAFPAAISIWVGVDGDRRLLAGVLAARISTLCTVAIAIAAAILNIVTAGQQANFLWIALGITATVSALVAMYSWATRAWLQWWFTKREAPKPPMHDARIV